eukprot:4626942-Ditylum_brightwellii.AAC.1
MSITEYVGEDISTVTDFIGGAHTILDNYNFLPPDFMQILVEVFETASDNEFIKHASTICTSHQLNLQPSMRVDKLLDNVKSFYQSKVKFNKWAKAVDSDQQFVLAAGPGPYEQHDFYNCSEKGGTSKSRISPDFPIHASHIMLLMEEAKGMEEDKNKEEAGVAWGYGGPQQQQQKPIYPKARELHVHTVKGITEHWCGKCASWKKDHGNDVNRDKCPNYNLALKTSKARVEAAATEAARSTSATGTATSDAQRNTLSRTVAADLSQNEGTPMPQSIRNPVRAMSWSSVGM